MQSPSCEKIRKSVGRFDFYWDVSSDFQTIDKTELPDRQKLVRMLFAGRIPLKSEVRAPIVIRVGAVSPPPRPPAWLNLWTVC